MITVLFKWEKETPGAVRYTECDADGNEVAIAEGAKIGTLYIRKSAFPKDYLAFPRTMKVQVTY